MLQSNVLTRQQEFVIREYVLKYGSYRVQSQLSALLKRDVTKQEAKLIIQRVFNANGNPQPRLYKISTKEVSMPDTPVNSNFNGLLLA